MTTRSGTINIYSTRIEIENYILFRVRRYRGGLFMLTSIIKRDRSKVPFKREKIVWAIFKAATAVGGDDFATSEQLANEVVKMAEQRYPDGVA